MRLYCVIALAAGCPSVAAPPTTPVPVTTPQGAPARPQPTPAPPPAPGPPTARTVDVVDKQFGIDVPDPYRWMEGQGNKEHTDWLRAQGEHAAPELAAIPG